MIDLPRLHSQKSENGMVNLEETYPSFSCDECGKEFQEPILATVRANGDVQEYYACPYCLAKIDKDKTLKKEEPMKASTITHGKAEAKPEVEVKCQHYFGYLKKRPRNKPIPDECLTCDKMIECLVH
jgi:DNA-directed RNA polymerase subunit RPC12/RpoP